MTWFILFVAGLFEIVWASFMKLSDGFTKPMPTVITLVAMLISFAGLAYAMRMLPLGTAYVIWTGIGAVGAFIVGILFFNDALTLPRVLFASLIVVGLVGLKFTAGE